MPPARRLLVVALLALAVGTAMAPPAAHLFGRAGDPVQSSVVAGEAAGSPGSGIGGDASPVGASPVGASSAGGVASAAVGRDRFDRSNASIRKRTHLGGLGEPPAPLPPDQLTGYAWPLPRGRITQGFGPSRLGALVVDGERYHDGLDIATFCGDRVLAAHDGVVLAAGRRFDPYAGWVGSLEPHIKRLDELGIWYSLPIAVVIDDGNGYRSIYAHLSRTKVRPGQRVRAGQLIGYEGQTGFATGCHLHFGLFSPLETATMALRADIVKRTKYPAREIARIDPLLVLPARATQASGEVRSASSGQLRTRPAI